MSIPALPGSLISLVPTSNFKIPLLSNEKSMICRNYVFEISVQCRLKGTVSDVLARLLECRFVLNHNGKIQAIA